MVINSPVHLSGTEIWKAVSGISNHRRANYSEIQISLNILWLHTASWLQQNFLVVKKSFLKGHHNDAWT